MSTQQRWQELQAQEQAWREEEAYLLDQADVENDTWQERLEYVQLQLEITATAQRNLCAGRRT